MPAAGGGWQQQQGGEIGSKQARMKSSTRPIQLGRQPALLAAWLRAAAQPDCLPPRPQAARHRWRRPPTREALVDFHLGLGPGEPLEPGVVVHRCKAAVGDHLARSSGFAIRAQGGWVCARLMPKPTVCQQQLGTAKTRPMHADVRPLACGPRPCSNQTEWRLIHTVV